MEEAIKRVDAPEGWTIKEGEAYYDCDFSAFEPIVKQMNEMGAPVTLQDLIELIEGKLSGRIISGKQDPHLIYTFVCHEKKDEAEKDHIPFRFNWEEKRLVQVGNAVYRVRCEWLTQQDDKKIFLLDVDFTLEKNKENLWCAIQKNISVNYDHIKKNR